MIKKLLLINLLLFSNLKAQECSTLKEMEEIFQEYLQNKSLEKIILSGKIIKKDSQTQIRSFSLQGQKYYALSTNFEIEKYESLKLLQNFKIDEIKNYYTNFISCAVNNDTLIVIFENFGKEIKNLEIKNYFLKDLNFENRLEIYKNVFEVISELEKKDLVAQNFDFLQNGGLYYENEKINFVADLIFNLFKTEKNGIEKLEKTSAPEEREENTIKKGTNCYKTLIGILFLELDEKKIYKDYPEFKNLLNENHLEDNLQKIKNIFQEIILNEKKFEIKSVGYGTKFFYWYWSWFGFFKVERIYNFEILLDKVFVKDPYYRISASQVGNVFENLKNRKVYTDDELEESKEIL